MQRKQLCWKLNRTVLSSLYWTAWSAHSLRKVQVLLRREESDRPVSEVEMIHTFPLLKEYISIRTNSSLYRPCSILSGIIGENTKHNGGYLVDSQHSRMGNMGSILCVSLDGRPSSRQSYRCFQGTCSVTGRGCTLRTGIENSINVVSCTRVVRVQVQFILFVSSKWWLSRWFITSADLCRLSLRWCRFAQKFLMIIPIHYLKQPKWASCLSVSRSPVVIL